MYFSIIIPIYNAEKTLSRTIESVLNQTFNDYELILVNDGSRDSSLSICQKYAINDKRIVVVDVVNGGVSKARNLALDIAKGDYICFLDADDTVRKDWLKHYASNPNADILSCGRITLSKKGEYVTQYNCDKFYQNITDGANVVANLDLLNPPWSKCYRSEIIRKDNLRFWEGCHLFEDLIFSLQFLQRARNIQLLSYVGYEYRLFDSVLTRRFNEPQAFLSWSKRVLHEVLCFVSNNKNNRIYWSVIEKQYNLVGFYLVDYYDKIGRKTRYEYYRYLRELATIISRENMKMKSVIFSLKRIHYPILDIFTLGYFILYKLIRVIKR